MTQVRIMVSGFYRMAYYHANELALLPDDLARNLIARQLAASAVTVPPLKRTGSPARGDKP